MKIGFHIQLQKCNDSWMYSNASIYHQKKFKTWLSARKIMVTIFWDRKLLLLVKFIEWDAIINAATFCETLKKLHHVVQNKWCGMLSKGCVYCTMMHTSHSLNNLCVVDSYRWDVVPHPPQPDLTSSNYHNSSPG